MVILIWRFGRFVLNRQTKVTPNTIFRWHYGSILWQSAKLNVRQSVFCYLIAKLNVRQMYHLYDMYLYCSESSKC